MPKIIFQFDNTKTEVNAIVGDTLLETAKKNGIKLFGGCDGAGVCGTCHVFIDPDYLPKLNEAAFDEQDLLDVLSNGKTNSRLACQIVVTEQLDGMKVVIP